MPGSYSNSASPLRTGHGDCQWHLFGCICVHTQQCLLAEGQRVLSELGFSGCWAGPLCPGACGSCLWPQNYEVSCRTLLEAGVFLSDRSVQEAELAIPFSSPPPHCWSAGNGTALSNAGGNQALSLHPGLLPFIRSERNFKTDKLTNKGNFIFLLELANLYCFVNLCDSVPVSHGEVSTGVQKSDKAQDISSVCFLSVFLNSFLYTSVN